LLIKVISGFSPDVNGAGKKFGSPNDKLSSKGKINSIIRYLAMAPRDTISENEFNDYVKRTRDQFRVITELKEKLDILTEHVQSRKEALDEEIEEQLHESIANARDSLEKIQENLEPKIEAVIRDKLQEIDNRLTNWKSDFRLIVEDEMAKRAEPLTQKIAESLDTTVTEKVWSLQEAMQESLRDDIGRGVEKYKNDNEETWRTWKKVVLASLVFSLSALAGIACLVLFGN